MPAPAYPLPERLLPLHLYRHILREVSYLPPAFRAHIDTTVRSRFHGNRKDGQHTQNRLSKARSSLRKLRAANSGDKRSMEDLILRGFGRKGSRRRELMAQLVKPQGPSDTLSLETMLGQSVKLSNRASSAVGPGSHAQSSTSQSPTRSRPCTKSAFFEKWDQPKLLHLLRSQEQQQNTTQSTTSWPRTPVKSVNPDQMVPETNIWGKPPTDILVKAKRANWWKRSANKIMPPLGSGEWDLLRRLSLGGQDGGEWARPARRSHPLKNRDQLSEADGRWQWAPFAMFPTATVELDKSSRRRLGTGLLDSGPFGGRVRHKDLSNRYFRRIYSRIWQLTPRMEQDPNTLKYKVSWGKTTSTLPTATKAQASIFGGKDAKGNKATIDTASG